MEQRIGRRKECAACSDGSCPQCKYRAYHREYNHRRRRAGGRLSLPGPDELRFRAVMLELTGEAIPAEKARHHQCYDLDCRQCQAAEELRERNRAQRAADAGCRCGIPNCDCAAWDKIYREKFADPTYYTDHGIPKRSPFADI